MWNQELLKLKQQLSIVLYSFVERIHSMTIRDAIDILLVSFMVYQVMKIVRGTKALRMLMGLLILVLLSFVARWFELKTLMWLFQNFWQVGVLIVVILFQPELRRGLADVGTIYPLGPTLKETMVVNAVVDACIYFSRRKIGALIVFERNMGLKNYVDSGILLDAIVSEELLTSIFLPYSPLHDGAVIIRGDRIAAAACLLPLSSDPMISKALGTRHRAAIGLTEETDAVVVVVSEETGIISLAVEGRIKREFDKETLREALMDLLYGSEKGKALFNRKKCEVNSA